MTQKSRVSKRCPHKRVQDFTECCLDCGRNIYETEAEYENYLDERLRDQRITEKERQLRLGHSHKRGRKLELQRHRDRHAG